MSDAAATGVFVLGMHRSGTSAITRAVNLLGVPLTESDRLRRPSQNNPTGFWEVGRLIRLNERLLAQLGGSPLAPPVLEKGWPSRPGLDQLRQRAPRVFRKSYDTDRWVWKDPRNSVLLPFWQQALDARPVIVLVNREPLQVARSLQARSPRQRLPTALAFASWERHLREALRNVSGLPVYVASYADLVADPSSSAHALGSFLLHQGLPCDLADGPRRVAEFVARPAATPRTPDARAADTAARSSEPVDPDFEPFAAQRELTARMKSLAGPHERFGPPDLPPETASTERLLARRRHADLRRSRSKRRRMRRSAAAIPTLWIVGGPSSVGKSRFLACRRANEVTGLPPGTPVLFPGRLTSDTSLETDAYLHYNILRGAGGGAGDGRSSPSPPNYRDDRRWRLAMRLPVQKRAVLLVADWDTLVERVRSRVVTEEGRQRRYRVDAWLDLYRRIDLAAIYDAWRRELDRRRIPVMELDATRADYPELRSSSR